MVRTILRHQAHRRIRLLGELERLRAKTRLKKARPQKIARCRKRVRDTLEQLRFYILRDGNYDVTNPDHWEIIERDGTPDGKTAMAITQAFIALGIRK